MLLSQEIESLGGFLGEADDTLGAAWCDDHGEMAVIQREPEAGGLSGTGHADGF
jgi:hypothetical protein